VKIRGSLTCRLVVVAGALALAVIVPAAASAHARVSPAVSVSGKLQLYGLGDSAVITKVTWTGGKTPTGEDSLFQFLAQPASSKTYTFQVQQTYSDGSIVNWAGPESSAAPAPTIDAKATLGGGGVSALTIIALAVGLLGLAAGGFALVSGGGSGKQRSLA
jgi:Domain of unkown function (DUF1775)